MTVQTCSPPYGSFKDTAGAWGVICGLRSVLMPPPPFPRPFDAFRHNKFYRQVLADVLEREILVHPAENGPAVGAAIYGACAAGVFEGGMVSPLCLLGGSALWALFES